MAESLSIEGGMPQHGDCHRRRAPNKAQARTDAGDLRVGTTSVPWVVCAMGPWNASQIVGHYHARPTPWPEPVKQAVRTLTQEIQQAERCGEPVPFNGLGYQLVAFGVSPHSGPDETPRLHLDFRPTDYFTMLATDQRLDAPQVIGGQHTTFRREYASQVDLRQRPVSAFATHFGVGVQIITADGLTLVTERGDTAVDAQVLFPSVAEGANRPEDGAGRPGPHPTRTAIRGLAEEWAVVVEPDDVHWVSFGANAVLCEYGMLGWVALQETWDVLERRRAAGLPPDGWEAARVHAIPFDPPAVAAFVAEHRPWSPFALAALYHTLLAHFRGDAVDRAFRDVHPVLSEGIAR